MVAPKNVLQVEHIRQLFKALDLPHAGPLPQSYA
jgi:hypothetical protein